MRPIPQKRATTQAHWIEALDHARAHPDPARAAQLLEVAADRIRRHTGPAGPQAAVLAWSGGKDSIVLELAARAAGVTHTVLVLSALEFPAFTNWIDAHAPADTTLITREELNLEWLAQHPRMLFPQNSADTSRWYTLVQHTGQRQHMRETGADVLILGRRTGDGNRCGPVQADGSRAYRDPKGDFTRLSPIWDWTHEDVLNVLAVHDLPLPPNYYWPDGFRVGTGPWAARQHTGSIEAGWAVTLSIDPTIVEAAAAHGIPGAAHALNATPHNRGGTHS